MTTKIQKWGNSLAVRIPKELAKEASFKEGSVIIFSSKDNSLVIKHEKKPTYTLKELLKDFDIKKQHKESDWGKPKGTEVW